MLVTMFALCLATAVPDAGSDTAAQTAYQALLTEFPGGIASYINKNRERGAIAGPRFLAFAREHPGTPESLSALAWVALHCIFTPDAGEAMDRIAKEYATDPKLGPILEKLDSTYGDPFEPAERMLRTIIAKSPHRQIRIRATLGIAGKLVAKKDLTERQRDEGSLTTNPGDMTLILKPNGPAPDLTPLANEAAALCEKIIDDAREFPQFCEQAAGLLRTIRNASVGCKAPETDGRDINGKAFKLSDFRGKAVMLTFVSSHCAPCRLLETRQREWLPRLKDKPVVFISVYVDSDLDYLKKSIDAGEITWRCWCDGGPDGPISRQWNVSSYPRIFLIDADGVIRHRPTSLWPLEAALNTIVKETEAKNRE